jgi:hypothetical protein
MLHVRADRIDRHLSQDAGKCVTQPTYLPT